MYTGCKVQGLGFNYLVGGGVNDFGSGCQGLFRSLSGGWFGKGVKVQAERGG